MGLVIEKQVELEGESYSGYRIVSVEWELETNRFFVKVLYHKDKFKHHKLVSHKFVVENDIDVNEMIEKVHNIHR